MPSLFEKIFTNDEKDTTHVIEREVLLFEELWGNYPSSTVKHDIDGNGKDFSDHCAINVSEALYKCGVKLKSFPKNRKCWGCPTPDSNGKGIHALAAQDLASYLQKKPFALCPDYENIEPELWEEKIKNRTGIVFYKDYWRRSTDSDDSRTGDHIDLWNENKLASLGFWATFRSNISTTIF
ncbi:T6SS effector amidase Tae4 family protein [Vibrio sp. PP-XX7]